MESKDTYSVAELAERHASLRHAKRELLHLIDAAVDSYNAVQDGPLMLPKVVTAYGQLLDQLRDARHHVTLTLHELETAEFAEVPAAQDNKNQSEGDE